MERDYTANTLMNSEKLYKKYQDHRLVNRCSHEYKFSSDYLYLPPSSRQRPAKPRVLARTSKLTQEI
jgi:hypothetical protein